MKIGAVSNSSYMAGGGASKNLGTEARQKVVKSAMLEKKGEDLEIFGGHFSKKKGVWQRTGKRKHIVEGIPRWDKGNVAGGGGKKLTERGDCYVRM